MNGMPRLYRTESATCYRATLPLLAVWLCVVLFLAAHHVFWRDEMRAMTLALRGENVLAMLRGIHGEGHPAVWYLLLRGAHAAVPRPEVLEGVSLAVAVAAMILLVLRAPFGALLVALILFSRFGLFEYSVMARNYGISMLLLFALAACYARNRTNGLLLGSLLFLLANCSAHSVLLAAAFLLFWLLDIAESEPGPARSQAYRTFAFNAGIAAAGAAICLLTLYPAANDDGWPQRPPGWPLAMLLTGLFVPAHHLSHLLPLSWPHTALVQSLMSLAMFGSTFGLARRRAALAASLAALLGLSLFFALVYPGSYRHEALWLVFLMSMYWIAGTGDAADRSTGGVAPISPPHPMAGAGSLLFAFLLLLQLPGGLEAVANASHGIPESRSRDLGTLVATHPELHDAVIIADPDYLVEPLPYYISNRTYLMRQQRFGNVVTFTKNARLSLNLDDVLIDARRLHLRTRDPVIILLQQRLNPSLPAQHYREGYDWEFVVTPQQVRAFQAATKLVRSFAPAVSDESYDVYLYPRS